MIATASIFETEATKQHETVLMSYHQLQNNINDRFRGQSFQKEGQIKANSNIANKLTLLKLRQIKQIDDPVSFISFGGDKSVSESISPYYPKKDTNDGVYPLITASTVNQDACQP